MDRTGKTDIKTECTMCREDKSRTIDDCCPMNVTCGAYMYVSGMFLKSMYITISKLKNKIKELDETASEVIKKELNSGLGRTD